LEALSDSVYSLGFLNQHHMTTNEIPHPPIVSREVDAVLMDGEEHGLSVFFRIDDDVFHTYSAYARGTESLTDAYRLLDMTPYGRQQEFEESPAGWPRHPTYG